MIRSFVGPSNKELLMETAAPGTAPGKSSTGMQPNFAALLAYVFGVITGLIFFLVEKESLFVKFHAMQSICVSIAVFVLSLVLMFIPVLGWAALLLLQLAVFVFWIICMIKAYQGRWYRLPIIGDFAAKQAGVPTTT